MLPYVQHRLPAIDRICAGSHDIPLKIRGDPVDGLREPADFIFGHCAYVVVAGCWWDAYPTTMPVAGSTIFWISSCRPWVRIIAKMRISALRHGTARCRCSGLVESRGAVTSSKPKMGLVFYTLGGASCQRSEPVTQPALCWMAGRAFVPDTGDDESGYVERRFQHLHPVRPTVCDAAWDQRDHIGS